MTDVGFSTFSAHIRPCSTVNPLMYFNVGAVAKEFPTCITLVSPLLSVAFLVLGKCIFAEKGFPTLAAHERLFSTVSFLVLHKCIFAAKGFPTFMALVGFCSTVYSLVLNKMGFSDKRFPTFSTLIRFWSHVSSLVFLEAGVGDKRFPTTIALIRLFSRVDCLVPITFAFGAKSFPTFTALVIFSSTVKGFLTLGAAAWLLLIFSGMVLDKCRADQEVLLILLASEGLLWLVFSVALHNGTFLLFSPGDYLSILLLRDLVNVDSDPEGSSTWPAWVWLRPKGCSLLPRQMQNVF